jgi:hypothetical protein
MRYSPWGTSSGHEKFWEDGYNKNKKIIIRFFIYLLAELNSQWLLLLLLLLLLIIIIIMMSRVCGDYIRRILDWQLDLLGTVTVTLNYSVYTLQFTMFTIHVPSLLTCVFTGCLSSNIAGSVHLQNSLAALQLFSEDCCFTVDSRLGNSTLNSTQLNSTQLNGVRF